MTTHQLEFDLLPHSNVAVQEKSAFADPAFAANKTLPVHRWVPWIAGFSSDFVQNALGQYLQRPSLVLDPFAGVGTSLAESMLSGHRALGFEINPYAALATRVKLQANTIDLNELNGTISRFCDWYASNDNPEYISTTTAPAGFKGRAEFYAPAVLKKVLIVQDYISLLPTSPMQDLFRLSFAATMVRYSNYSYEPSLGRRVSAGREEIHDFPVGDTILSKLREMAKDIEWMQSRFGTADTGSSVIHDSFFNAKQHLVPAQVDLVITSPPTSTITTITVTRDHTCTGWAMRQNPAISRRWNRPISANIGRQCGK